MRVSWAGLLSTGFVAVCSLLANNTALLAEDEEAAAEPVLPETVVMGVQPAFEPVIGAGAAFGGFDAVFDAPGSGAYLDQSRINTQSYDNVERVLQQAPGVYVRTENGYGHFPSISLRGVETTRSGKITVMEDGILIAPAPYSAPAVYYFPNVGRMHAVEVIKGHSQVMYGPHTLAGAINFISTPIPEQETVFIRGLYGTNNEYRIHTFVGDTMDTQWGRVGYMLEGYLRESDGFKTINQVPGLTSSNPFSGIGNTQNAGFTDGDAMLKFFWEPNTCRYTRWEAKVGYGDYSRNETYCGLSEADFLANPYQRYPATQFDNYTGEHITSYVRFLVGDPETDCLWVSNTAYYNQFHRNWYKLNDLRNIDTNGDGMADGVNLSMSAALAGAESGAGLEVLQGRRVGTWRVRANNRDYYSYGYETVVGALIEAERFTHDVKAGVRYHADQIHPVQHDDQFTINDVGFFTGTSLGAPGEQRNRVQETHAVAFYVQDAISMGCFTVTPGLRAEHINMSTINFNGDNLIYKDTLDVVAGGVGLTYDFSDNLKFLGGFHRGFSPPSPRGATGQGTGGVRLEEEESLASELGFRYLNADRAFGAQLIGFHTHFNDLMVFDILAVGGGSGDAQNVGQAYATGIEFSIQYDPGVDRCWGFSNPWFLTGTYTEARLLNDVSSGDPGSIFAGGTAGNRIPYIPEWAVTLGTGLHFDMFGMDITGIFVDDTFTTASNTTSLEDAAGDPDSRFGKTDDYFIWDISGYIRLTEHVKLFGGVQNATDLAYLASRHPHGPRPGHPLFGYMGFEAIY